MNKYKVLVTGAAGLIASQLLPAFRQRYDLTLVDVKQQDRQGNRVPGVQIADLTITDRDRYRHFFKGQDAVVHLGHIHSAPLPASDDRFRAEMQNIEMAFHVYQTALEEEVPRVVVASSNHAADYYEPLILDGVHDFVNPADRALSDNYYGWAKEVYEHLGFMFAVGKEVGRSLPNVQIRIGGPRETDIMNCDLGDLRCARRALAVYISDRDMQQLFVKSIEHPDIEDEHGVPFQIFYGISDNPHAFWSIANARRIIGYQPQDNSERRFAEWIARHIEAAGGEV